MEPTRRYSRAPITEALIDLRVRLPHGITVAALEKPSSGLMESYPERKKLTVASGQMELGERLSATASSQHVGYCFVSADQKQIAQLRLDGFTFSRLAPYESWENFRDEARRIWNAYKTMTRPEGMERLAVRYINRLDLPFPVGELKDFLRTAPEISSQLPQMMAHFFMQVAIPQMDLKSMLLLNETIIEPVRPEVVSVVLDIDLFRDQEVPQDEEKIWEFFEELHLRKNEIFEACITDQTRKLIH